MKYIDDNEAIKSMVAYEMKEVLKLSKETIQKLEDILDSVYYTANTSFKVKVSTSHSIMQAFLLGYKSK